MKQKIEMNQEERNYQEFENKLHKLCCELLDTKFENKEYVKFQSIVGMVYTLTIDNRLPELYDLFQVVFPEYYSNEKYPLKGNQK